MVTLDQGGRVARAVELCEIPAPLRPWVEQLFVIDFRRVAESDWKVLPDTCGHLLVHSNPSTSTLRARVVGARTKAITTDVTGRAWTVGVRFRPGALASVSRDSAARLTDGGACPEAVWGSEGRRLLAAVGAAGGPQEIRRAVVRSLVALTRDAPPVDWRARGFASVVRSSGGTASVSEASDRLGIASRTLRNAAHDGLGLAPKQYARIARLFRALRPQRPSTWSARAAKAGFSDHAHLVRECRKLLGETPTQFAARGMPKRPSA